MYFMSDPQALHVTRNVIPGKLGVDLHLHRVHIPLVSFSFHHRDLNDLSQAAEKTSNTRRTPSNGSRIEVELVLGSCDHRIAVATDFHRCDRNVTRQVLGVSYHYVTSDHAPFLRPSR